MTALHESFTFHGLLLRPDLTALSLPSRLLEVVPEKHYRLHVGETPASPPDPVSDHVVVLRRVLCRRLRT